MEESDGGISYLVTMVACKGFIEPEKIHHDGIMQYRVKHGALFLYDKWREDEFGIESRLVAVYGSGQWYKMDRV